MVMQNPTLPVWLVGILLPFGIKLSSPQNPGCGCLWPQLTKCQRGLSSGGNWLGRVQYFCPTRELIGGSLYLCPLLTLYLGRGQFLCKLANDYCQVGQSLKGPPGRVAPLKITSVDAASSMGSSSVGISVKASWVFLGIVTPVQSSRYLPCRLTPSKMASLEKDMYGSIVLLSSRMHLTKRHGWPSIGGLDFSVQFCRTCA